MRYWSTDFDVPFPGSDGAKVHTGMYLSGQLFNHYLDDQEPCHGRDPACAERKYGHCLAPVAPQVLWSTTGCERAVLLMSSRLGPPSCAGFYVSYNNSMLEPNITESIRKMAAEHPGAPLYAIGHSMGAALATICAMDVKFKAKPGRMSRLYTFGSPRVGNAEFAKFVYNQTKASCCAQHFLSACDCQSHG